MKTIDFETSTGVRVKLRPISPDLLDAIRLQVKMPEPPSYEIEVLGGGKEKVFHDEKSVETDEEKAAWDKYKEDLEQATTKIFEKQTIAVLRRCVLVELPDDDVWIKAQKADSITIPDATDLKFHYIQTEVIGGANDLLAIVSIVRDMSRYNAEDLAQAMNLFRSRVERHPD